MTSRALGNREWEAVYRVGFLVCLLKRFWRIVCAHREATEMAQLFVSVLGIIENLKQSLDSGGRWPTVGMLKAQAGSFAAVQCSGHRLHTVHHACPWMRVRSRNYYVALRSSEARLCLCS